MLCAKGKTQSFERKAKKMEQRSVYKVNLEVEKVIKEINDLDHKIASELKSISNDVEVSHIEGSFKVWQRLQHKESILGKKS